MVSRTHLQGGPSTLVAPGGKVPAWAPGPVGQSGADPAPGRLRARTVRRGIPVRVRLSESARTTITVRLRGRVVARVVRALSAGSRKVTVKPSKIGARRLRGLRRGVLNVSLVAVDKAGNRSTAKLTLRLT